MQSIGDGFRFCGRLGISFFAPAVLVACGATENEPERSGVGGVERVTQAWHDGAPHEGVEPFHFDETLVMCAPYMGTVVNGYTDDVLPAVNLGPNGEVNSGWGPVVQESEQGYGGGYGPPTDSVTEEKAPRQISSACEAEFPQYFSKVEQMRGAIHCECASPTCKAQFPNDEAAQRACTPNYSDCFLDFTSCRNTFRVEARATARGWVPEANDLPVHQAEIDVYYNDLADSAKCSHEHASYFVYVVGPGSDWSYLGSFSKGTADLLPGDGPGGCKWSWDTVGSESFKVPPVVVLDQGLRIRILSNAVSHTGINYHFCGTTGCTHPVGVRVDYAATLDRPITPGLNLDEFWFQGGQLVPMAAQHSAGQQSQILSPGGMIHNVYSPTLNTLDQELLGDEIWIDVFTPQTLPDATASLELRVSIPSADIPSRTLGVKDLQTLTQQQWNKLRFPLGQEVRDILEQDHDDVVFSLAVSTSTSFTPVLIDNFRFAENLVERGRSPKVRARNLAVSGTPSAPVSVTPQMVNAGSTDPNGDPLTFTLVPPGPFPVGTTTARLGASDGTLSATAAVKITVVDSGPGFAPDDLVPLAWYRASASTLQLAGTAVSQWQDSSGNAQHLVQSNSALRPQYAATGWNGGAPAVTFDGVDDVLEYSSSGSLLGALAGEDRPFSVLLTWEPQDLDADRDLVQWDNGGVNGGNSLIEIRTNATGADEAKYRHRRGDGVTSLVNTGNVKFDLARRTTAFVFDGTALTIYDGTATHLSASANDRGPVTIARFRLGDGDNVPLQGRVAELVVTDYALSSAMVQQYRDYAQATWGGL